jgi:uncharacterized iron-regulated membrane protein
MLHRKLSTWVLPLLIFIAGTGLCFRIGRAWFGISKDTGQKILYLHSGGWFGASGSVLYLFVLGSALIFLIVSGLWLWFSSGSSKAAPRKIHRVLAIIFSLPLMVTAITGMAYQAGSKWFHVGQGTLALLSSLHQGSWLGPTLRPYYILLLASSLIALCLTGFQMLYRKNRPPGHVKR